MSFIEEIARRRTFGIISHPDAGKTTLTEKLLLIALETTPYSNISKISGKIVNILIFMVLKIFWPIDQNFSIL